MSARTPFLPVFLDLRGASIVVAGGDAAAAAKAKAFVGAGGRVQLISPRPSPEAMELSGVLRLRRRGWLFSDLMDCDLVCAGPLLSDAMVERLAGAAAACGAKFYAIDRPAFSDFSSGASIVRGALTIAISSAGAAPALGQALRREVERLLPVQAGDYVEAAAQARPLILARLHGLARRRFWAAAADDALMLMQTDTAPQSAQAWRDWLLARLDGADAAPSARIYMVDAPAALDDLTLKDARALSRADVAFIAADAAPACLALLRREAERQALPSVEEAQAAFLRLRPGVFAVAIASVSQRAAAQALAQISV